MPKHSTPTANRKTSGSTSTPTKSSSQDNYWEAIEILDQKGDQFLVSWAGIDPETGKQWEPTWESRKNCTRALLETWRPKQLQRLQLKLEKQKASPNSRKRQTPISITSTPTPSEHETPQSVTHRKPSSRHSTATPQPVKPEPETQTSEYIPSQKLPLEKNASSPTLRTPSSKKRKISSFKVVIPSKASSVSSVSVALERLAENQKQVTPPIAKLSGSENTPEERKVKKRKLVPKVIEDSQPESHITLPPQAGKLLDIVSNPSQSQVRQTPVESQKGDLKETLSAPKSPAKQSSSRRSRSRQPTPSHLSTTRQRSISPVTKVDSWLSIASENDYEDVNAEHTDTPAIPQTIHSDTPSQINHHPAIESAMNSSNPPSAPSASVITPGQYLHRQTLQARSNPIRVTSQSPGPAVVIQGRRTSGRPIPNLKLKVAPSTRQSTESVASRQSFSSAVALRERLQGAQNTAAIEEIRSLASYGKKTPSLASSAAGSSILSSGASMSSLSTTASLSNLKLVNLGEQEMILAVSGTELQSRMTRGVLINKQAQIQKFCLNPTGASKELTESMKTLMTTCSAIATHPYLIITPPLANSDLAEPKEAEYIVASSGKFVALGKILDFLRGDKEIKIGIVVQHIKGMELLEGFLRGKGIRAVRTDGAGVREQQVIESRSGANVTLVIGGKAGTRAIVNRVDVVIAMDLSFNPEDDQILRLRQHPTNIDELAPVIHFVTVNSAEHVRLCLPSPHEIPSDRTILQGLVSATTILRNFNGMEIPNDDARFEQVAEFIRSKGQKETDVFGIRDIEGYMAGHRGLAGLALKRARSPTDDPSGNSKRFKTSKTSWQQPSMLSLQRENDEVHETLAQKQLQNESLRTDLHSLQSKFDTLTIEKAGLEGRLEQTNQELQLTRALMTNAPLSDPMFLEGEVARLTKLLESKTKDFDFVTLRYQESSAAASESAAEVVELKKELESLKIKLEMDVKAVSWEGEKKALMEKVSGLEEKCKLLEERAQRVQKEA